MKWFPGFEDVDPRSVLGAGDVKYHVGATGTYVTSSGQGNRDSSGLQTQVTWKQWTPVAMGRVRAKQTRYGRDSKNKIVPIVMHGGRRVPQDREFGQRPSNLADLKGYNRRRHHPYHCQQSDWLHDPPGAGNILRVSLPISPRRQFGPGISRKTQKIPMPSCASAKIAGRISLKVWQRCSCGHHRLSAATATVKWTIPPSRNRACMKRIKNHPPLWKIYAERTGIDTTQNRGKSPRRIRRRTAQSARIDEDS